jgi:hypothetical protein
VPGWLRNEPKRDAESDSMIAVAINVRRVSILLGIFVFLTLGSTVLSLLIANIGFDFDTAKMAITIWGVIATIVTAAGLWYAVNVKRVTVL